MLLDRALNKAKRTDEEKVGLNIKVPIGLKNEFDEVCKKNGVSMTSMMLALIETVIDEAKGRIKELDAQSLLALNNQIIQLEVDIRNMCSVETDPNTGKDNLIPYAHMDNDAIEMEIFEKKSAELKRLKKIFDEFKGEDYDSNN